MAEDKVRLEFQLSKDDWQTYVERLELYFMAQDKEDDNRPVVRLTKVSADTYTLIRDMYAPVKPKNKSLEQLVKLVGEHLCPKPSEAMERCKFHQAAQRATESVAEFAARLKKFPLKSNFPGLQNALRDQLLCGLREHVSRVGLFCEKNLTFDKACEYAIARELAKRNASDAGKRGQDGAFEREVNMLRSKGSKTERGGRARSAGVRAWNARGQRSGSLSKPRRDGGKPATEGEMKCYCCGGKNHEARNCRH